MNLIDRKSALWNYMSVDLKDLIEDGELLVAHVQNVKEKVEFSDFSFMVFPFAKAYEGFLKKFFFDMGMISYEDYFGDEIRVGRILNPRFIKEHGNIIIRMCDHSPEVKGLSEKFWLTWKKGRNRVFHYFPHNFRKLGYEEALETINEMFDVMQKATVHCRINFDPAKATTGKKGSFNKKEKVGSLL